mgnify:CR=1 FL=1
MLDSVALGHQSLWNAEGERVGWLLALKPRAGLPSHALPVSYTHLTLPTKRIV